MVFLFMLAQMEDFTDAAYRTLAYRCGCDITFTEKASIEGMMKRILNTVQKIMMQDSTPTLCSRDCWPNFSIAASRLTKAFLKRTSFPEFDSPVV